jgi:hypothetical protein
MVSPFNSLEFLCCFAAADLQNHTQQLHCPLFHLPELLLVSAPPSYMASCVPA